MNLLIHLRKSIMCAFQTISFLIQMHFCNLGTQTSHRTLERVDLSKVNLYENLAPNFWKISHGNECITEAEAIAFEKRCTPGKKFRAVAECFVS